MGEPTRGRTTPRNNCRRRVFQARSCFKHVVSGATFLIRLTARHDRAGCNFTFSSISSLPPFFSCLFFFFFSFFHFCSYQCIFTPVLNKLIMHVLLCCNVLRNGPGRSGRGRSASTITAQRTTNNINNDRAEKEIKMQDLVNIVPKHEGNSVGGGGVIYRDKVKASPVSLV